MKYFTAGYISLLILTITLKAVPEQVDYYYYTKYNYSYAILPEYVDIICIDSLNCAAIGNLDIFPFCRVTSDGGKTWKSTLIDTSYIFWDSNSQLTSTIARSISYPSHDFCFIVGDSGFYWVSRDTCKTWAKSRIPTDVMRDFKYLEVKFINKDIGIVYTYRDFYITTNSCKSWYRKEIKDRKIKNSITNIDFIDTNLMFIITSKGMSDNFIRTIYKVTDFGESWDSLLTTKDYLQQIYIYDTNDIWACGENTESRDMLIHSTDMGKTWKPILDTFVGGWYGISKISKNRQYMLATPFLNYYLWYSTDYGKSWKVDSSLGKNGFLRGGGYITGSAPLEHGAFLIVTKYNGSIWKRNYSEPTAISESPPVNNYDLFVLKSDVIENMNDLSIYFTNDCGAGSEIAIVDISGKVLEKYNTGEIVLKSALMKYKAGQNFSSGTYFVRILCNNRTYSKMFILR